HALFLQEQSGIAVMVCEEDHLRIQCILPGLALEDAYRNASRTERPRRRKYPSTPSPRGYKMAEKTNIQVRLFAVSERAYADFQGALLPTVPREKVIGVRTPLLRKYAAEIYGTGEAEAFLTALPHEYFEENNLHAFLLEKIKDFDECVCELEKFLPYVDNWATCDGMSPKVFARERERLLPKIREWLASGHTYTVRFAMLMLMKHFTGERFRAEYADAVANVQSEEYYIKMMQAWYFATALATNYEAVLPYLTEKRLAPWVHNKTVQKAVESRRIRRAQKEFLRTLRV
ncbi:MAG: DNA alkylation repair protein, partial [Clostridia bacterium]|nr:DNA alkylation repair protein [Clostridia bacterium]